MNVVWFKRDLRDTDHGPLSKALAAGRVIALFVIEPEWMHSEEFSRRHLQFALQSLADLQPRLWSRGVPLLVKTGSATDVFAALLGSFPIKRVYSHQETGSDWSYQRDLRMQKWLRERSIPWMELPQFGVHRGPFNRSQWASIRRRLVERPVIEVGGQTPPRNLPPDPLPWSLLEMGASSKSEPELAIHGGRTKAVDILEDFLFARSSRYLYGISSPELAQDSSSRLSAYLCWGTLSMTEVHHALRKRMQSLRVEGSAASRSWLRSLSAFESRLCWHCHFIQKMESEPEIEFRNFNRGFDGMRESQFREDYFQAWCQGKTGYPLVDACMKALHRQGWINFRMRAMLMSFASYQLWLHWRKPAQHLARLFIDYEPGIHWSQVQMQSGVTGINTIRIYSPVKQAKEQDPKGAFIRRHLPELRDVALADLFEPHRIPPLIQLDSHFKIGRDYPEPIVPPDASYRAAKERIFQWKRKPESARAARQVYEKHGSRRRLPSATTQKNDEKTEGNEDLPGLWPADGMA